MVRARRRGHRTPRGARPRPAPRGGGSRPCLTSSWSAPVCRACAAHGNSLEPRLEVLVLDERRRARRPRAHRRAGRLPAGPRLPGPAHRLPRGAAAPWTTMSSPCGRSEDGALGAPGRSGRAPRRPPAPARRADGAHPGRRARPGQAARRPPGRRLARRSLSEVLTAPQVATAEALRREASRRVHRGFWRPFLGGVFLDPGSLDVQPPVRLRLQDVRRRRGGAARRGDARDPAAARGRPSGGQSAPA